MLNSGESVQEPETLNSLSPKPRNARDSCTCGSRLVAEGQGRESEVLEGRHLATNAEQTALRFPDDNRLVTSTSCIEGQGTVVLRT